MYPSRFDYVAPETLSDALSALAARDDAKVLAGGQSLIPVLKLRVASTGMLVDINRIEELHGIVQKDGYLRIGALVRHKECERSDVLRGGRYGVLGSAAPQISDPIVRNLGTVCGSIAHADPQGDWGSALIAANAKAVATSSGGAREIPVSELFLGPFMTTLQPGEIVTEVRVPDPGPRTGGSYLKLERKVGDFATAAVGVQIELDDGGRIRRAGIGLTGVGATNIQAVRAEESLAGAEPTDEAFAAAARLAADEADPIGDHRGSVEYKRNVIRVFVERGLRAAADDARAAA